MCHTYILFSETIDTYYVGYTCDDLIERLRKHNTNHKGYTGRANDWKVVYSETFVSKTEAYKREREIKSKKSRVYIKWLIDRV
ncbi:GIY-YIG nuclease family protein [uncultured Psychroserpens sp.]|uniref:GIY-YIG nuclease family protein n=1 Tax=uncultured Psychroserpens sp. TaxID=255436 RepID=UPI002634A380|nr:GIY-YIG nuclease family protein [uncultured Psychroserpens sp.]